jgi:hypothetical protein
VWRASHWCRGAGGVGSVPKPLASRVRWWVVRFQLLPFACCAEILCHAEDAPASSPRAGRRFAPARAVFCVARLHFVAHPHAALVGRGSARPEVLRGVPRFRLVSRLAPCGRLG